MLDIFQEKELLPLISNFAQQILSSNNMLDASWRELKLSSKKLKVLPCTARSISQLTPSIVQCSKLKMHSRWKRNHLLYKSPFLLWLHISQLTDSNAFWKIANREMLQCFQVNLSAFFSHFSWEFPMTMLYSKVSLT